MLNERKKKTASVTSFFFGMAFSAFADIPRNDCLLMRFTLPLTHRLHHLFFLPHCSYPNIIHAISTSFCHLIILFLFHFFSSSSSVFLFFRYPLALLVLVFCLFSDFRYHQVLSYSIRQNAVQQQLNQATRHRGIVRACLFLLLLSTRIKMNKSGENECRKAHARI